MQQRTYIAIDLKSFYASVECAARQLDPLHTNLVVADPSRTEKTICLAVSPSLKAYGIPGRPRLFEVVQKVSAVNAHRLECLGGKSLRGESWDARELARNPALALSYITAPPRMSLYLAVSAQIYKLYLNYIAPEDIHVYSIDEVFIDATAYLNTYRITPRELTARIIRDVLNHTGITATAGIGTNLYLAKVAMDIVAKRLPPDRDGVRIACLDEQRYRELLWSHQPLTDFWRVGPGYARTLTAHGLRTMGDIARCSLGGPNEHFNEGLLYRLFGVNAELLIDHAWGWEPCTMADIKAYRPESSSISTGQVLPCPYPYEKARLIVKEMADQLALELVSRNVTTDQVVLSLGYDREVLRQAPYSGPVGPDSCPPSKHAHGSRRLSPPTASGKLLGQAVLDIFQQVVNPALPVRRVNLTACHLQPQAQSEPQESLQLTLFDQPDHREALEREQRRQQTILALRQRYGKNAVLKGMNLQEGATTIARNSQIGGHKA